MRYLAKGKRGITYLSEQDGEEIVVKERNPSADGLSTLENEYSFLKKLNREGIGPEAYGFEDGKLYMEYVEGELIIPYLESHEKEDIVPVLKKLFSKLKRLDEMGINKFELTYPHKHIMICDSEPRMIDFERCRHSETPQNVTQFSQFLISDRIHKLLEEKGFSFSRGDVIDAAQDYKNSYSEKSYHRLLEVFGL